MHLLVLSAFRLEMRGDSYSIMFRVSMHLLVLSAFRRVVRVGGWACGPVVSMHLLVLSAFRLVPRVFHCVCGASQCTFWCSVLSDAVSSFGSEAYLESQCTFWCSVLSDSIHDRGAPGVGCLNAPFGAQCFPTGWSYRQIGMDIGVSMHLLVLSAFRQETSTGATRTLAVSMHLLVLSAFRRGRGIA